MSYGVVRVQKMTMGSVRGIEIHDRREKDGISHSNPDIDWSRSGDNYDLHPNQCENFYRAVKSRIESLDLKRGVRKDAVVMAQVLVTSDTAFFDDLRAHGGDKAVRDFFQASYGFLADRYGKENIISATVHLDERTPHMHFNFVPVTADGRLCAKEVTARARLISQQDEFREVVGQHFGLLRGEPKEVGKRRKHLETAEYKAVIAEAKTEAKHIRAAAEAEAGRIVGGATAELDKAIQERDTAAQEAVRIAQESAETTAMVESLKTSITPLRSEYEAKKVFVAACDRESNISILYPPEVKVNKGRFGQPDTVTVPKSMWEAKWISANEKDAIRKERAVLERAVSGFHASASGKHIKELEQQVSGMKKDLTDACVTARSWKSKAEKAEQGAKDTLEKIKRTLGRIPDDAADAFIKAWKEPERQQSQGMER